MESRRACSPQKEDGVLIGKGYQMERAGKMRRNRLKYNETRQTKLPTSPRYAR